MTPRIYIDEQTGRKRWRVRVMVGGKETYALYQTSKYEAEKSRRLLRKVISAIQKMD